MGINISQTAKLTFCVGIAAGIMSPMPAVAQFGGLFGSKSKDDRSEASAAQSDPAVNTGSGELQEPAATETPKTASEAEMTPKEGATSFDTLCNNGQGKPDGTEVRKRRGIFGMADRMSAITRKIPLVGDFMVDSANSLSQAIACRLYPEEQKQAAEATQEVTRSAEVGNSVAWQSTVRDNVSGSSTISAKNQLANGTPCLVIADIVIIDGEETKVSKKMCRLPGATRYTIITA